MSVILDINFHIRQIESLQRQRPGVDYKLAGEIDVLIYNHQQRLKEIKMIQLLTKTN